MRSLQRLRLPALALMIVLVMAAPVFAHQPFFEDRDFTAAAPYRVANPTISTAVYAALTSQDDIDYYAFTGRRGQRILLAMTIPQIDGQKEFAPTMALIGPGLPEVGLPTRVVLPPGAGALILPPPEGEPTTFYEPFTRTSYWERQEQRVTLPANGRYVVAVWHPQCQIGRYTFVIGDKERLGGDPAFPIKLRRYWNPLPGAPGDGCE